MKKNLRLFVLVFTIPFIAQSCKKDDVVQKKQDSKLVQSSIAGVNGPTTGLINQELSFSLVWQNAEPATKFDHLQDSASRNIKIIKLYTLTNVADTAAAPKALNTIPYKFKAATAGVYYLKFYKADNAEKTAIIDTITIK